MSSLMGRAVRVILPMGRVVSRIIVNARTMGRAMGCGCPRGSPMDRAISRAIGSAYTMGRAMGCAIGSACSMDSPVGRGLCHWLRRIHVPGTRAMGRVVGVVYTHCRLFHIGCSIGHRS